MLVFIVLAASALLAVCTSIKPIYQQNTIDAVGTGDARPLFVFYAASILGILVFEAVRRVQQRKTPLHGRKGVSWLDYCVSSFKSFLNSMG